MAIDRRALVQSVFDTLAYPSLGPVTRGQSVSDTTIAQIPFDTVRAKQLLDSLGWRDANGDGVRERNGRPLEFGIIVPAISASRLRLATLIQAQLKRVGVTANLEQMDFGAFLERQRKRQFDATMGGWATDPSPSGIRQLWTTAGSRSSATERTSASAVRSSARSARPIPRSSSRSIPTSSSIATRCAS